MFSHTQYQLRDPGQWRLGAGRIGKVKFGCLYAKFKVSLDTIGPNPNLLERSLDSVVAVQLIEELEKKVNFPLDEALVGDFPTIEEFSEYVAKLAA